MGGSFRLGRFFGIPININYTWFILFFLVTSSLALSILPARYSAWSPAQYWGAGVLTSLLFFASVLAHELAHSAVARAQGTPVKGITLFVFGGVAQISREATRPLAELLMAFVGPFTSLVLAGVFASLALLLPGPARVMAGWLALVNLSLALFNLIPGFPLDGGRVLRSIMWALSKDYGKATRLASLIGRGIAYLFILGGILWIFTGQWVSGIWIAFIGWFLDNAASSSYRQTLLREGLAGFRARELMTQDFPVIPQSLSLRQLVQEHILNTGRRYFLVAEGGRLEGLVTLHNIRGVPQEKWDLTGVGEVMTAREKLLVAGPDDEVLEVLERMDEANINQMPVVEEGRLLGVIARDNLLRFIRTRSELGQV